MRGLTTTCPQIAEGERVVWNEGLRGQQEAAAGAARGHLVVLAGPGTGKTHVLVRRVEYLTDIEGIAPEHITALTFSRAAAAQMRERLEERLGNPGRRVKIATLHSYALRQLMAHGSRRLPLPVRIADDWEERWIVVEELSAILGQPVKAIQNNRDGALDLLADDWNTLAVDGDGWEAGFPDSGGVLSSEGRGLDYRGSVLDREPSND
jgi:DNA helicase-2/ATP-dependent DNA helicase PcrA